MRSTFHEGNFYFTGGHGEREILFICSLESLIASSGNGKTRRQTIWRRVTTLADIFAIASYVSNLIGIGRYSTIRSYSNKTEEWIKTTSEGDRPEQMNSVCTATAVLSTGQLLVVNIDGVHKGTLSG